MSRHKMLWVAALAATIGGCSVTPDERPYLVNATRAVYEGDCEKAERIYQGLAYHRKQNRGAWERQWAFTPGMMYWKQLCGHVWSSLN